MSPSQIIDEAFDQAVAVAIEVLGEECARATCDEFLAEINVDAKICARESDGSMVCSSSHGKIYVPPDVAGKIEDVLHNVHVKAVKTTLEEFALRAVVVSHRQNDNWQTVGKKKTKRLGRYS